MPSPSIVFSFVLATLYGAAFHVISGGDARRLALFLLAAWLGFALGQTVAETVGMSLVDIGPLHVLPATVGAWLALVVARLLTRRSARSAQSNR